MINVSENIINTVPFNKVKGKRPSCTRNDAESPCYYIIVINCDWKFLEMKIPSRAWFLHYWD